MAQFNLTGVDDLIKQFEKIKNIEETAKKMIDAATPTLKSNLSKNIEQAANRGYATGELASAVSATKAKQNNYGYFAAVGVTGTDSKGVRNAEKMAYMEFGVDGKQVAHPVIQKTVNESEQECLDKMQEVFNAEVGA